MGGNPGTFIRFLEIMTSLRKYQASDYEGLSEIVVNKIRALKGVNETKTLTGAKF